MKKIIITYPKSETLNGIKIYAKVEIPKEKLNLFEYYYKEKLTDKQINGQTFLKEWLGTYALKETIHQSIKENKRRIVKHFEEDFNCIVGDIARFLNNFNLKENRERIQVIFY